MEPTHGVPLKESSGRRHITSRDALRVATAVAAPFVYSGVVVLLLKDRPVACASL